MSKNSEYIERSGIKALVEFSRCDRQDFVRTVKLGVCIPTFKQRDRVVALVDSILSSQMLEQYNLKIYLVDQGGEHSRNDFGKDHRINFYCQENLGGSGGFSRAMREAIADGSTHILLMDDDVTVEAKSIKRVIHFYSSLPDGIEIALNGAMYAEEDPNRVYEAGARLYPSSKNRLDVIRRLAGELITDKDDDPRLFEDWKIDYGAWFFFACSAETVREVGMPLPFFIRGDDQEYGLRLQEADVKTVCLPGLSVLHPSHGDKIAKWPLYFHWRNSLVINRLHRKMNPIGIRVELLRKILFRWLGGQNDLCRFIWEGWKDSKAWSSSSGDSPEKALQKARKIENEGCNGIYDIKDLALPLRHIGEQDWPRWQEWLTLLVLNGRLLPKRNLDYLPVLAYKEYHWMKVRFLREYGIISKSEGRVKLYRIGWNR